MNTAILILSLLASPAEQKQTDAIQAPGFTIPAIEAPCRINRHKRTCTTCWHD